MQAQALLSTLGLYAAEPASHRRRKHGYHIVWPPLGQAEYWTLVSVSSSPGTTAFESPDLRQT